MQTRKEALELILKGCTEKFADNGFELSAPVTEEDDTAYAEFTKGDLTVKLLSHDNLLDVMEKAGDGEFVKTESNLLDLEDCDERSIKSLCNEINDTVVSSHGKKARQVAAKKAPHTVSKSAAKNGANYDAYTLASRITQVYPELKNALTENVQTYSEFLGDDFFVNHANRYIMETIRYNDQKTLKKLFKILSDIYENGSNDVQDLVVVTILGELNNEQELIDRCLAEITDDDFAQTIVAVNKYLASSAGKKAKELMKNPPAYKPPKKKTGGMMSSLANMQPPQQ